MNPATASCDVIVGLVGRWQAGDLPAEESDVYEQHLLFCPPCLTYAENYRTALSVLPRIASSATVPRELLDECGGD